MKQNSIDYEKAHRRHRALPIITTNCVCVKSDIKPERNLLHIRFVDYINLGLRGVLYLQEATSFD